MPDLFVADRAEARRGGRFRWFFSTCLAAGVGALAIVAVMIGSMETTGSNRLMPTMTRHAPIEGQPQAVPRKSDGMRWAMPKTDRLQVTTGAASTKYIVQESVKQVRANREYLQKKPYARILVRLGAVAPDPSIQLPAFKPEGLFGIGAEGDPGRPDTSRPDGGDITFRVVELLGSLLPSEDGQEMTGQEAAELLRRSTETPAGEEPGIRPAFIPEGAKITLPRPGMRGRRGPAGQEEAPAHESILEKTTNEIEDMTTADSGELHSSSLYASLFVGAYGQGIPEETIMRVLRAHAHEIDFRRRARPNDTADFFFDLKDEDKGAESSPGELLYTALNVAGQSLRFYRYRTPDGVVDFYDEFGSNSRRFLMRQPVQSEDARLTSGYGMRFHPLLNQRKMHTGVDWSVPIGTPILAAGNGVVEEAHYKGPYGNYIRIRHANGYQTTYGHMSRFATGMREGLRVRQGQIIGYVGTTGLSTGPHLHYEVMIGERFVDPVRIPIVESRKLSGRQLADFQRERARIEDLMGRPPVRVVHVENR